MPHLPSRACAFALALVAFSAPEPQVQELTLGKVCTTDPEDLIDFVEVVQDGQRVSLSVYHERRKKRIDWSTDGRLVDESSGLQEGDELLVSEDGRALGFRRISTALTSVKEFLHTHLHFFDDKENQLPDLENLPGVRDVRISAGADTVVCAQRSGEHQGPASVEIYAHVGNEFVRQGSYRTALHGRTRMSRDGRLIAQEDLSELKLFDRQGSLKRHFRAGSGFALERYERDPDHTADVLFVLDPSGVRFIPADAAEPEEPQLVPLPGPGLGVSVQKAGAAVIFTANTVHRIDLGSAREITLQKTDKGQYSSIATGTDTRGRSITVVGRLEVLTPARRRDGQFKWGTATAYVDILDDAGKVVLTKSFGATRWLHDSPRVQFLEQSKRILVHTGDTVLLSDAVTLP